MPTVAHQARGQFRQADPNREATLVSPNKVVFALSAPDARELALEFAKAPQEAQAIISQQPVRDLLAGHHNPRVRELVDLHLRPLLERIEDTRDIMEGERLIRTDLLDVAALARIDERINWIEDRGRAGRDILGRAGEALNLAREQTGRMQGILSLSMNMKRSLRHIDRFFKAVREGNVRKGTEKYSNFLIDRVRDCAFLSESEAAISELYISLIFGDATKCPASTLRQELRALEGCGNPQTPGG